MIKTFDIENDIFEILNEVINNILDRFNKLNFKYPVTLREIYGEKDWDDLPPGVRRVVGRNFKTLIKGKKITNIQFAGNTPAHAATYK